MEIQESGQQKHFKSDALVWERAAGAFPLAEPGASKPYLERTEVRGRAISAYDRLWVGIELEVAGYSGDGFAKPHIGPEAFATVSVPHLACTLTRGSERGMTHFQNVSYLNSFGHLKDLLVRREISHLQM